MKKKLKTLREKISLKAKKRQNKRLLVKKGTVPSKIN